MRPSWNHCPPGSPRFQITSRHHQVQGLNMSGILQPHLSCMRQKTNGNLIYDGTMKISAKLWIYIAILAQSRVVLNFCNTKIYLEQWTMQPNTCLYGQGHLFIHLMSSYHYVSITDFAYWCMGPSMWLILYSFWPKLFFILALSLVKFL